MRLVPRRQPLHWLFARACELTRAFGPMGAVSSSERTPNKKPAKRLRVYEDWEGNEVRAGGAFTPRTHARVHAARAHTRTHAACVKAVAWIGWMRSGVWVPHCMHARMLACTQNWCMQTCTHQRRMVHAGAKRA